jgi:hypothetical protein
MSGFRIGFTGTREPLTEAQTASLRRLLEQQKTTHGAHTLHHGDCVGADATAHAIAKELGYSIVIHPPTSNAMRAELAGEGDVVENPLPYLERNRKIVDAVGALVACPKGPEERRSGTWFTVRYALRMGVPVVVVWPDGRIEKAVL